MSQMRIIDVRLLPGCSAGLSEPTALVEITHNVPSGSGVESGRWARLHLPGAFPAKRFHGITETEWPDEFLIDQPSDCTTSDRGLGEWIIAVSVALQRLVGSPVGRGRVTDVRPERLLLAIPWIDELAFNSALDCAVRLLEPWSQPEHELEPDPQAPQIVIESFLQGLAAGSDALPLYSFHFALDALRKGIPLTLLPGFIQLGWGACAERFDRTHTGRTGLIAAVTAQSKLKTNQSLLAAGLPVPRGDLVADLAAAEELAANLGWPVVVKPANLHLGIGVVPGIKSVDTLRRAFAEAERLSPGAVIVESHVKGEDYRLLVVRGRAIAVAHRIPGGVVGDGVHTVAELVDQLNTERAQAKIAGMLKPLELDAVADELLATEGLTIRSVPELGRRLPLRRVANTAAGGDAQGVTAQAHPDNLRLAERAVRILGLDLAGVDLLTPDIGTSWREAGGAICEVNVQPALHWVAEPDRDLTGEIVDIVIGGRSARIPTAAITGAGGDDALALILQHIWTEAGALAGVCTTKTVRIGEETVECVDFSMHRRAHVILNDPGVEAGIFEFSSRELDECGHPCDRYDVAAVLSVPDGNCGVPARTREALVVNANDPRCLDMRRRTAAARHILVTNDPSRPPVAEHRALGGEAVFVEEHSGEPWTVLAAGESETPLMPVREIGVAARQYAMFAAAMAWAHGIGTPVIRQALATFDRSPAGRADEARS